MPYKKLFYVLSLLVVIDIFIKACLRAAGIELTTFINNFLICRVLNTATLIISFVTIFLIIFCMLKK